VTAAQVRAAERATIELGQSAAIPWNNGAPTATVVNQAQRATGYSPTDGRWTPAFRAHLARLLASQQATSASRPRDDRHLAARQLSAYLLAHPRPDAASISTFQRRLGVEPTGRLDRATATAIQEQFSR
jgi:hypothetical protein